MTDLLHPTMWRAHDIASSYDKIFDMYLEKDTCVTIEKLMYLFSLCVEKYAE